MKAVLIPGDGIGREIAQSVRKISDVLATGIEWEEYAAGAEYAAEHGELLQPGALDAIEEYGWALKGPTATPIGKGFRSINVQLRQRFNTYANLRPVRTLPGVPTRFENVDLVIVRENTEDLYKGIEYMLNDEIANGVKLITKPACERICRFAFDYAAANGRKKVTAVHKANIMKLTDGIMEFISRVKAVLRRASTAPASTTILRFGDITLDDVARTVTVDGEPVELTFKEYSLLHFFLEHPEEVLARERIMKAVWDTDDLLESRTIDMHVRTLRQKLGHAGDAICTVRKVGYKLSAKGTEAGEDA